MKKYIITVQVKTARGMQVFGGLAESEADALSRYTAGEFELEGEEIEVIELIRPSLEDVEESD